MFYNAAECLYPNEKDLGDHFIRKLQLIVIVDFVIYLVLGFNATGLLFVINEFPTNLKLYFYFFLSRTLNQIINFL